MTNPTEIVRQAPITGNEKTAHIGFMLASLSDDTDARAAAISQIANLDNGQAIINAFKSIDSSIAAELQAARWVRIN